MRKKYNDCNNDNDDENYNHNNSDNDHRDIKMIINNNNMYSN